MDYKRLARDLAILLAFCATFYFSTYVAGKSESTAQTEVVEKTNYSDARIEGDESVENQDWESAIIAFKQMTEEDPFNGYAWYKLSRSYSKLRESKLEDIKLENAAEMPSDERIREFQSEAKTLENQALASLEKSREFLRYRGNSLYHLAVIYTDQGEFNTALDCLDEFVNEGYWLYTPMDQIPHFGSGGHKLATNPMAFITSKAKLHQFDRFWDLVEIEAATRRKMEVPRPVSVRVFNNPGNTRRRQ